jgi:hypothetical protein
MLPYVSPRIISMRKTDPCTGKRRAPGGTCAARPLHADPASGPETPRATTTYPCSLAKR